MSYKNLPRPTGRTQKLALTATSNAFTSIMISVPVGYSRNCQLTTNAVLDSVLTRNEAENFLFENPGDKIEYSQFSETTTGGPDFKNITLFIIYFVATDLLQSQKAIITMDFGASAIPYNMVSAKPYALVALPTQVKSEVSVWAGTTATKVADVIEVVQNNTPYEIKLALTNCSAYLRALTSEELLTFARLYYLTTADSETPVTPDMLRDITKSASTRNGDFMTYLYAHWTDFIDFVIDKVIEAEESQYEGLTALKGVESIQRMNDVSSSLSKALEMPASSTVLNQSNSKIR